LSLGISKLIKGKNKNKSEVTLDRLTRMVEEETVAISVVAAFLIDLFATFLS